MKLNIPYFSSNVDTIDRAFRIAAADVVTNVLPFCDGLLKAPVPCIIAGLGYVTPWTRDAAINTWNAGGLLFPEISKNTLLSVLTEAPEGLLISGEYWDAIIWATGAWNYYLATGDKEFLEKAYLATKNSLEFFEETEFDEDRNLFRGGACFQDGVAGYPDQYADHNGSGIMSFVTEHPDRAYPKGKGVPCMALSTNCLYYNAYRLVNVMAKELKKPLDVIYDEKAKAMKTAINKHFWLKEKGTYRYLVDDYEGCDFQEGLGLAFALLFDIADEKQAEQIFKNVTVSDHGIPCVYPSFSRYDTEDGLGFGRHSGTVWPHVQAFFADGASYRKKQSFMEFELLKMAEHAVRDSQFAEIYHPLTGEIYGGRQEHWCDGFHIREWKSEERQTWSATGFLRTILYNVVGMTLTPEGIHFAPNMVAGLSALTLKDVPYRDMMLEISVKGTGRVKVFKINGKEQKPFVSRDFTGLVKIEIELSEE